MQFAKRISCSKDFTAIRRDHEEKEDFHLC